VRRHLCVKALLVDALLLVAHLRGAVVVIVAHLGDYSASKRGAAEGSVAEGRAVLGGDGQGERESIKKYIKRVL
jgi:hypothetical protein